MSKFDEYGYNVSEFESFNDFESLENEKRSWRIKIENKIDDAETSIKENTNKAKDEINNNAKSIIHDEQRLINVFEWIIKNKIGK